MTSRDQWLVEELRTGHAVPFGPKGQASAIGKQVVDRPLRATLVGLEGDEQGDRVKHGGPDKAIHLYPKDHYPLWRDDLPRCAAAMVPGGFGENLVIGDIDETMLCLGDRLQLGDALVEVSQGRQPCWKLNVRFNQPDMARRVQDTGRTGWYFRVLEDGMVQPGCLLRLTDRPHPEWSLDHVNRILYHDLMLDFEALAELAALPGLPPSWRKLAETRLSRHTVEDWGRRIESPDP